MDGAGRRWSAQDVDEPASNAKASPSGCLRTVVVLGGLALVGAVAFGLYLNAGVAAVGERAQRQLDEVGRALDRVPLLPGIVRDDSAAAVGVADREPKDAAEAERSVRADRLGDGIAFFVYCGDQCPSWEPGDAVVEHRHHDLRPRPRPGAGCDAQARALEAAGVAIEPVPAGSAIGAVCSFAGCIDDVGIRLDLRSDGGSIDSLDLVGAIGATPDFVDPLPDCR